jgi:hypothetical protein
MTKSRTVEFDDAAIVEFIREWQSNGWGYGPSKRDISYGAGPGGIPLGTVHRRCVALREAGIITYTDHVARSIALK